jgi:TM2 domain-containing membrane protein YozV
MKKSKTVAALLCFFFGMLGVHRFYLGHTNIGIVQLVLTIVGIFTLLFFIGLFLLWGNAIWIFIEFILILIGKIKDSKGNSLS